MKTYALIALLVSGSAHAMPAQILLLRHGEKPADGNELSPRGWERAKVLPQLFEHQPFKSFGVPAALYGMSPASAGGSVRAIQTLKYAAEQFGLTVITSFRKGEEREVARAISTDPKLDGRFVVLCWEHKNLTDIAAALGVSPAPKYPDDRFDRAWLLTMGKTVKFEDLPENLLPGDQTH